jgi:hypothetical protein
MLNPHHAALASCLGTPTIEFDQFLSMFITRGVELEEYSIPSLVVVLVLERRVLLLQREYCNYE